MNKLLFVDNDEQILEALKITFQNEGHILFFAKGGKEALDILEKETINMIICDLQMPIMDGFELLTQVKKLFPQTLRLILSDESNNKLVYKVLHDNIANVFLLKPWVDAQLISVVNRIFKTESLLKSSKLLELVKGTESLPTIRANYLNIVKMLNTEDNISAISKEIERDASIATKILHFANSAFYGVKTGSIHKAICYIGIKNTKNLVHTTSIIDTLGTNSITSNYVENIWKQASLSNKLLAFIYHKHLRKELPESYASAGLLLNVGTVFMLNSFKQKFLELIQLSDAAGLDPVGLEKELFGVSHCEAGGFLLQWWEFPYPIIETALYHHIPLDDNVVNQELLCAAHLAVKYSSEILKIKDNSTFDERVFDYLNISKNEFDDSLMEFVL